MWGKRPLLPKYFLIACHSPRLQSLLVSLLANTSFLCQLHYKERNILGKEHILSKKLFLLQVTNEVNFLCIFDYFFKKKRLFYKRLIKSLEWKVRDSCGSSGTGETPRKASILERKSTTSLLATKFTKTAFLI
jgi:hypothetical protein